MAVSERTVDRSLVPDVRRGDAATETPQRPAVRGLPRVIVLAGLAACSVAFLVPFLWLVSASLKIRSEVFNTELIPSPVAWVNYARVWQEAPVGLWLFNSILVGVLAVVTVVASSALVAFGFTYFQFKGRNVVFALVLATMMLPGAATMVPTFLIWNYLGWVDTHVPLWAGNLFGSAFYIFMLRQFFLGIPRDLFDAARVDGANPLQIWWKVAMPLTKPALIVVAIFEFKASWTDLIKPLIYLHDRARFTMPLGLKAFLDQFGQGGISEWEIVMAASVIFVVPMIVIFLIGQRYFVQGIATTGTNR